MAPTCVEVVDKPLRVADISVLAMQSRRAAVPLRLVPSEEGYRGVRAAVPRADFNERAS